MLDLKLNKKAALQLLLSPKSKKESLLSDFMKEVFVEKIVVNFL